MENIENMTSKGKKYNLDMKNLFYYRYMITRPQNHIQKQNTLRKLYNSHI